MSLWDLTSGRGTELAGLCWTLEPLVLRCHSDGLTRAEAAGGRQAGFGDLLLGWLLLALGAVARHSDGLTRAEAAGGRQVLETCCLAGCSHWELSLGLET